jgi:hypothetical protein
MSEPTLDEIRAAIQRLNDESARRLQSDLLERLAPVYRIGSGGSADTPEVGHTPFDVATVITAGVITADKISVGARSLGSLVVNGDFEDGTHGSMPLNWTSSITGDASVVKDDTPSANGGVPLAGTASLSIACNSGAGNKGQAISDHIPIVAGQRVYVQCEYKSNVAATGNITIWISWKTSAGGAISDSIFVNDGAVTAALQTAKGYATAPATTAYGIVNIRNQTPSTNVTVVFDDVLVQRMSGGVLNSDGNVVIDSSGVTIINGKITVTNAGSTVIIDGTSNMFKIAATGTLSVAYPAAGNFAPTFVDLTALGDMSAPPVIVCSTTDDNNAWGGARGPGYYPAPDLATGHIKWFVDAFATLSSSPPSYPVVYLVAGSALVNPGTTAAMRYYVLKEAGI